MRSACAVLLLCLVAAASCRDRGFAGPTPPTSPTPPLGTMNGLMLFTEGASGFATSDVRDAQDQVIQFSVTRDLIWAADGRRFSGYPVSGIYVNAEKLCACWFEVRFGTVNGERRAYLTADYGHDNPGTLLDIETVAAPSSSAEARCFLRELTHCPAPSPKPRRQVWFRLRASTSIVPTGADTIGGLPTRQALTRFRGCMTRPSG